MKRGIFLTLFIILGLWSVGFYLFLRNIHCLEKELEKDPPSCQGVVVFTGAAHRIPTGYDLFQKAKARGLLISGVKEGVKKEHLFKQTSETITLGYDAYNTHTNALEAALWAKKYGFTSLCLVTSLYHMPRSLMEFKAFLPQATITPFPVLPPVPWWKDQKQFYYLLRECQKFYLTRLLKWMNTW